MENNTKRVKDVQILHVPTWEYGKELKAEATIEFEFGDNVLEGEMYTAAHHAEKYKNRESACMQIRDSKLKNFSRIVINKPDIDTYCAMYALLNFGEISEEFFEGVNIIDKFGHREIDTLSKKVRLQIESYWALSYKIKKFPYTKTMVDVTEICMEHMELLHQIILENPNYMSEEIVEEWRKDVEEKVENCLIAETPNLRVFETFGIKTSGSYFSKRFNQNAEMTISYNNKKGTISIATINEEIDCKTIAQTLWGCKAGGHKGISGSPRGIKMDRSEFLSTVKIIKEMLKENQRVA